jgi:hypothetical protein
MSLDWLGTEVFADTSNGIQKFFAASVRTQQICTKRCDGTEVCASGDQFAAILAGTAAAGTPVAGLNGVPAQPASGVGQDANTGTTTMGTTLQPPVLKLNGANPANITPQILPG